MMNLIVALACLQESGIAAQYPGDEGIEKDPRVLFVEDFETGTLEETATRWGGHRLVGTWDLSSDLPGTSPGQKSLHISAGPEGPKNHSGAYLYTHMRPVDRLHARFYVKFHPKHGYLHHFVMLIADREPTPWPKGWAGHKPAGDDHFISSIEPWSYWGKVAAPGAWNFYSYWQDMKPDGRGDYWGNGFPAGMDAIPRGEWICMEVMVKANSAGQSDGEQAFWINGKPVAHFKDIRWRSTDLLKLNSFWLQYDVDDNTAKHNSDPTPGEREYEVWFDDIVLATDYIGPVQGKPRNGKKVATPSRSTLLSGELPTTPPGKVVFAETFAKDPGSFKGGEIAEGGLSFPAKGAEIWGAFSPTVSESTQLRFKLRALADVKDVTVLVWSDKLKDNARRLVGSLKKDETRDVSIRGIQLRAGWAANGPSLEGAELNNFKIVFDGAADARVLLSDFEVRQ
ncbi:MAG TPA: hypothetical protein VNM14_24300 [Planctomycetota bacterium]|jgi:hypothetical protein|nr:hypothetical protein [Planctomycetota bacterium]